MNNNGINSKETHADQGWRAAMESKDKKLAPAAPKEAPAAKSAPAAAVSGSEPATAPKSEAASGERKATQADKGWRGAVSAGHTPTQVDAGWRREAARMLGVDDTPVANAFLRIEDFREAVGKLEALVSKNNRRYAVKKTLSREGGESAVLLCADPKGRDVVAKVYYEPVNGVDSAVMARSFVLDYMATEEGLQYTLAVVDVGVVSDFGESKYYFEIMPYCPEGDVSDDGAYDFDELVMVIRRLNEILHSLHGAGILHRDIKPQNVYKTNHGVVLGDFGIARRADLTGTSWNKGTYGYQAPETQIAIANEEAVFFYDERCDYYSLGVTIATMYEGHFVYEGMSVPMVTKCYQRGTIPIQRDDEYREYIENLVSGLCRFDPEHRFGYDEVNKWLTDFNYRGAAVGEDWPRGFGLLGESYGDAYALFCGITQDEAHWNEAKELLYKKYFEQFFKSFDTNLARAAQDADELYRGEGDGDKGLFVFLKALYAPGAIVWKGRRFDSLSALGAAMLSAPNPAFYSELLSNHCISCWLDRTSNISVGEQSRSLVTDIELLAAVEPELACFWFGNSFAEKRRLVVNKREVSNLGELLAAMFSSARAFYQLDAYKKLLDRKAGADMYGFLFSLGFRGVVDAAWEQMADCDVFHKTALLLAMMDNIAVKGKQNPALLRRFFVSYGPVGVAAYTQSLVVRSDNPVYIALDREGQKALEQIASFQAPPANTTEELFRAYLPLVESVEQMRRILIDNPYCIQAGDYDEQGVLCANLMGCFAFNIFDRPAPLGFSAWLEASVGGGKG